jgi:hypothetical protein
VNLVGYADALVETLQVGAAAEQDVLAVVDDFVYAGMQIGGRPAAEIAAALDEVDGKSRFSQGAGRAHACDARADHRHRFLRAFPPVIQSKASPGMGPIIIIRHLRG